VNINLPPKKRYTRIIGQLRTIEMAILTDPNTCLCRLLTEVPGKNRQTKQFSLMTHMRRNGLPVTTKTEGEYIYISVLRCPLEHDP
jgi:hypothetical protein